MVVATSRSCARSELSRVLGGAAIHDRYVWYRAICSCVRTCPSYSGADGCGNQPPITGWLSQPAGGDAGPASTLPPPGPPRTRVNGDCAHKRLVGMSGITAM